MPTDILEQGYSGGGLTFVMFAQFDSTGPTVSGILTQASVSAADQTGVATTTFSFTGTKQGQVVTLDVPAATGGRWTATIDGSALRLRYTDSTGLPAIITMTPASLDTFVAGVREERDLLSGSAPESCTVGYPNHNATVTIAGSFAHEAATMACASAIKAGYVSVAPDSGEPIICKLSQWGTNGLVVRDTGGQVIGSQICKWVQRDGGPSPTFTSTPANYY